MATNEAGDQSPTTAGAADAALPPVSVVSGAAFELAAELAAFASGPARASLESGKPWIREVRTLAGPDLIRRVEGWSFAVYAELASFALETGAPHAPGQLVERLRDLAPDTIRRRLVGAESAPNRSMVSDGAFDRALDGDATARAELVRELGLTRSARQAVGRLLTMPPEAIRADVAGIVEEWASRVFPAFADQALGVVARDVATKTGRFAAGLARDVLRDALSGVEVTLDPWATEIVVVPTVALRPFLAPIEHGPTVIYLCSVADEAFDDDPAAPPRRLVKVAAAMGDPLRLRILRALAERELTASEIADLLGVERTSLHHHLGILRSAGLLAIRDDGMTGWRYARRADGVADATAALEAYLGPTGH
jgi:DNA-binding transcriptional ArsR family regulator